jgi:hypothetical protein
MARWWGQDEARPGAWVRFCRGPYGLAVLALDSVLILFVATNRELIDPLLSAALR